MKNITDFNNKFIVEDGRYLKRWDASSPLFDNFYILGPDQFDPNCKPRCLFWFSKKAQQKETNNSLLNQNQNNEIESNLEEKSNQEVDQLTQFFFPDGIHYCENDQDYLFISCKELFSKEPKVYDHIIFIKNDGSVPHYYFVIRFQCSPFTRPPVLNKSIIDESKKDRNLIEDMNENIEEEMIHFSNMKTCPTCLFSYVFETQHPFFEFYFNLIHQITHMEALEKLKDKNYQILLNNLIAQRYQSRVIHSQACDDDDNDDFIIVNKIDSYKTKDTIISIQDKSHNVIVEKNIKEADNESFIEDLNCYKSNSLNISWPIISSVARSHFLGSLLKNEIFQSIGKNVTIQTGLSLFSKFSWRVPTRFQSCCSLIHYGIIPLFDWITLTDFIRILSLLFLEVSVIVTGNELESIVRVVTSLQHIVFPFAWMFPTMTIVPDSFTDVLNSPLPFIAGVTLNEKNIKSITNLDDFDEILIIDIENQTIKWPKKQYPNIACQSEYINTLRKYCTPLRPAKLKRKSNSSSDVIVIQNENSKNKKWQFSICDFFQKVKNMSIIQKINHTSVDNENTELFFDSNKINDIVNSVLIINQNVFASKVNPSIVTRLNNEENGEIEAGSMMVDELYFIQFSNEAKSWLFIELFMKTQMFISYREQACKSKTEEQIKMIKK